MRVASKKDLSDAYISKIMKLSVRPTNRTFIVDVSFEIRRLEALQSSQPYHGALFILGKESRTLQIQKCQEAIRCLLWQCTSELAIRGSGLLFHGDDFTVRRGSISGAAPDI
jgi:hypothetical protein